MEYVGNISKESGCIFCRLKDSKDDRGDFVIKRGSFCFIVLNRYPYINGHLMISTYRHISSFSDMNENEMVEMLKFAGLSVSALKSSLKAEGINAGFNFGRVAGAGVEDHIHFHVVPRWNGDNNFMPVLSDTRSLPEYLTQTYDKLVGEI